MIVHGRSRQRKLSQESLVGDEDNWYGVSLQVSAANSQVDCLLFKLPRELRDKIYELAFTPLEQSERFNSSTHYSISPYLDSPLTTMSLLQSCKRAYSEAWSIWWFKAQHNFWLSSYRATSSNATSPEWLAYMLTLLVNKHSRYELENVRFVGQKAVPKKEPHQLPLFKFFTIPNFCPVNVNIVIRHTDWPLWTCCEHLRISGMLPRSHIFPSSVKRITLELETLESKTHQLLEIVQSIQQQWCFSTTNGAKLTAERAQIVMQRWQGSSTWGGKRWARDESQPEVIDYVVVLINFELEHKSSEFKTWTNADFTQTIDPPEERPTGPILKVTDLEASQVPPGTDGLAALELIREFWLRQAQEHREKMKKVKQPTWRSWFWK